MLPNNTVTRYRVKASSRAWTEPGPDLLRTPASARRQLAALLHDKPPRLYVKVGDHAWKRLDRKAAVMDAFDAWVKGGARSFRVGLRKVARVEAFADVQRETFPLRVLADCSPGTSLVHTLIEYAFPHVTFAGGYVWKTVSGSTDWSDHAWGTAEDETPGEGEPNDKVTDWLARMAAAGLIEFDYALGSRDGHVVYVDSEGGVRPSGASTSHLWHVHVSVIDHDGRKPPRTGGVW